MAFFGVKLGGKQVVLDHTGTKRLAIITDSGDLRVIVRRAVITVHKVKVRVVLDTVPKRMVKIHTINRIPAHMWYFAEKLEDLGVTIDNKLASGQTHQDRKLISGDGPLAANDFGKMSANELLKALN